MTHFYKRAILAAVMALGIATPAFAQSFDGDWGTGNVLPFRYQTVASEGGQAIAHPSRRIHVARRSGLDAYAMVAGRQTVSVAGAAATGGASAGYEQMLKTY